jgi:hypothetical protein
METSKNYAVFILTHGRPDNVITYNVLRSSGYTGKIYLIVDDEDQTLDEYKKRYKNEVIIFSKNDYQGKFDLMDNFRGNKVIVYARNACYDIARNLGLDYFFEYEDDYTSFYHRYIDRDKLKAVRCNRIDDVLLNMIDLLDNTKSTTIALAQGGDCIGGVSDFNRINFLRKAMNSFLFKVNEDPKDDCIFIGRMNDDVNTYLTQGKIGKLFFQIAHVILIQKATQSNAGGNTEAYKEFGTYLKSFYSVMAAPSCCKITMMGTSHQRIHHKINWNNAVPKILHQRYKKTNREMTHGRPVQA